LIRSQCQAHTNLLCALCYQKRDHSVEPYECQNKTSSGEETDEKSLKARLIGELADSLVQASNVDRQGGVERGDLRANPA
jgi:hypothetical protein